MAAWIGLFSGLSKISRGCLSDIAFPMSEKPSIPPEAAKIMQQMLRMPPKHHEDMKVGGAASKAIRETGEDGSLEKAKQS